MLNYENAYRAVPAVPAFRSECIHSAPNGGMHERTSSDSSFELIEKNANLGGTELLQPLVQGHSRGACERRRVKYRSASEIPAPHPI